MILWEGAKGGGGGGGYLTWAVLLWARQGRRKPARGEEVLREAGAFHARDTATVDAREKPLRG